MDGAQSCLSIRVDARPHPVCAPGHEELVDHLVRHELDGAAQIARPHALADRLSDIAESGGACALEICRGGAERGRIHHRLPFGELDAALVSGDDGWKADRRLEVVERATGA